VQVLASMPRGVRFDDREKPVMRQLLSEEGSLYRRRIAGKLPETAQRRDRGDRPTDCVVRDDDVVVAGCVWLGSSKA